MKFILVLLGTFLTVNSYSASSDEMCFHGHRLMEMYHQIYKTVADNMFLQSKIEKKPLIQTFVNRIHPNHCLIIEGDEKIILVIKDLYNQEKNNISLPGNSEITDTPVNVFISGIPGPFLSLPEKKSDIIFDSNKNPITISARLLHPKIIELTYGPYKNNFQLDEQIWCLRPMSDTLGARETIVQENGIIHEFNFANPSNAQPHYLKRENNFIEISTLRFKASRK